MHGQTVTIVSVAGGFAYYDRGQGRKPGRLGIGLLSAGWFWSMGCTLRPGEALGLAYGVTVMTSAA